ncbi:carbohydrate ABC transporter permease [Stutzerimonas stutzeri]|uniref:Carbohydrate ABC transporter membrane protein 1 (CUT1 family) n=1 Tax=Stutzerimonas stutzeri TaxID=316 RepID=A0A5S5BMC6_STUST|nr:sugar ABC transporter permease [Stutzerimonas stutzeri]TYP67322.1 carbohydrate ABC transporter membrane protein 1 (CUT1 family) [Stutzerimonas stutzeri]
MTRSGHGGTALLLGAPALALMMAILILPILAAVILSFTDYSLGASDIRWVGFENYAKIFGNSTYEKMLIATGTYVAVVVPASIGLGLGAALLIQSVTRGAAFYKSVYFLPVMATLLAMTIVWQMMLHPTIGVVNRSLLGVCGVLPDGVCPAEMPLWLGDRNYAIWVTCFIGVWQGFGFNMVLYLAGLSGVSRELYGAAEIDGARSAWERFRLVTWPALRPTTVFVLITTSVRAFQTFDTVEVLFSPGGGPSKSVYLMMFAIYEKGIVQNLVGIGAAITVLFLISVMALTVLQRRIAERKAY